MMHLAAIPLEILAGIFIVEELLEKREKKEKRRMLMFIKSYVFRSEMLNLIITNFDALKFPAITMVKIKKAPFRRAKANAKRREYYRI